MRVRDVSIVGAAAAVGAFAAFAGPSLAGPGAPAGSGVSPQLIVHPVQFRVGQPIDASPAPNDTDCEAGFNFHIPLVLGWQPVAGSEAIKKYDVRAYDGTSDPHNIVSGVSVTNLGVDGIDYQDDCGGQFYPSDYQVVAHTATNEFGGDSASVMTGTNDVMVWQEDGRDVEGLGGLTVAKTGTWGVSNCTCFNWGQTAETSQTGATIKFSFKTTAAGQYVGLVMPLSANRGKFSVSVDGKAPQTVDSNSATTRNAIVIWQSLLASPGKHTVLVKNLGTAGHPRIDVDSVLLTHN